MSQLGNLFTDDSFYILRSFVWETCQISSTSCDDFTDCEQTLNVTNLNFNIKAALWSQQSCDFMHLIHNRLRPKIHEVFPE